ncbi:MAG: STAS domain-containing protein [Sulfuritalea sp.]|nr:STAS domain-containing protein [Sulfuritalea sp.]
MTSRLQNYLPFLRWFPMSGANLRIDLLAGVTVALVLVPQSMAYALLAGLPVVYGLYAALAPVVIGALFGNFHQLHTGPVVMLSLMSAAAIAPFALAGSEEYIALSILLALMVGVILLIMGIFKIGSIVNLVSHPVMVGFINAAALIIGLSQLRFFMNMPNPGTGGFTTDISTLLSRIDQAHLPAIAFGVTTILIMWVLARWLPKLPAVLVAALFGTIVSAAIGYEQVERPALERIADPQVREKIAAFSATNAEIRRLTEQGTAKRGALRQAKAADTPVIELEAMRAEIHVQEVRVDFLKKQNNARRLDIHAQPLVRVPDAGGASFYRADRLPAGAAAQEGTWRFQSIRDGQVTLAAGGDVVGAIPQNLPSFKLPKLDWNMVLALLPAAFVIALIGFLEATVVSKTLAAKTHQRIEPNKELIGQGLANFIGSLFQSYVVSGSFSRSAIAGRVGAKTGLFAVISALFVLVTLLFLTPYLYHLPQAVLAAIVMMAVFGLIRISPLIHAWKVQRSDAIFGIITFVATLAYAPKLSNGILLGMILTAAMLLLRTMKPRAAVVGRREDGSLAGIDGANVEPLGRNFVAVRFDNSLTYLNVAAFEDTVLEVLARHENIRGLLVIASGINEIDASGEEKVRELVQRLRPLGVEMMFSSLKRPVAHAFRNTGLDQILGEQNIFPNKEIAIVQARERFDREPA